MTEKKDEFLRINGDTDFQGRSASIFGCLDKLEPQQNNEIEPKPLGARAPKRVPDHVLHPEKWTEYSLEDDGTDKNSGMTGDVLNRHVALSFMDEIRKRKENQSKDTDSEVVMSEKHVFSKSAIKHKMEVDEVSTQSQIVEGVNVMPEYVVGVSPAKTSRKEHKIQPADKKLHSSCVTVCLGHLEEKEVVDDVSDISKTVADSVEEQQEGAKFTKRKVKKRSGLREHKSSAEDE